MTGAPYTNPMQPPPVTGRSFKRIGLTLLTLLVLGLGGLLAVLYLQGKSLAAPLGEKAAAVHKPQSVYPPLEEKVAAKAAPSVDDLDAKRWAEQQRINQAILAALEELKKRKTTTTVVQTQHARQETPLRAPAVYCQ